MEPIRQGHRATRRSAVKVVSSRELPRSASARVAACSALVVRWSAVNAVSHPSHQLPGGCAGLGRELVAGVAQVVEVEVGREAHLLHGRAPLRRSPEVATPEPLAELTEEHVGRWLIPDVFGDVRGEVG